MHAMDLRVLNRQRLLRHLIFSGPITRNELRDALDLSYSTVGNVLDDLAALALLRSEGAGTSTGGRRAMRIAVRPTAVIFVCLDLSGSTARGTIVDLSGTVLASREAILPTLVDDGGAAIRGAFCALLDACRRSLEIVLPPDGRLGGVALAVPGHYRPKADRVVNASYEAMEMLDLGQEVHRCLGLWPRVLNDAGLAARHLYRDFAAFRHGVCLISFPQSLGGALICDGKIYTGAGQAGEIYNLTIDLGGCCTSLGDALTPETMWRDLRLAFPGLGDREIETRLRNRNFPRDLQVLEQIATAYAAGIAQLASILHPELVLMAGCHAIFGDALLDAIRKHLETYSDPCQIEDLHLELGNLPADGLMKPLYEVLIDDFIQTI